MHKVNYFDNLEVEYHFLKIGYNECNFVIPRGNQCNLSKNNQFIMNLCTQDIYIYIYVYIYIYETKLHF